MTALAARNDRWKAPAEDGRTLIWPSPDQLFRDTRENQRRLSSAHAVLLQGIVLSEVRQRFRESIGHTDDCPLIATGHQAELHHGGVWAKNALIDATARALGGRAVHFAVDTDEPKHLDLRWPGGSVSLSDDASLQRAEWSALLPAPSATHLNQVEERFAHAAAGWDFRPMVPEFLVALRRLSSESSTLPAALTNSLHELDRDLGLRYDVLLVAPTCASEPYLLFVHHLLARAGEFASHYNEALDEFRRRNKIRTPGRPMPNLRWDDDSCEVPFWLDALSSRTRVRASVVRAGDQWALRSGDEEFRFDPSAEGWSAAGWLRVWLHERGLRLSPRALTLTAVLRLLVADQFVHGIGGGQYDQVLDALIARHFRMQPPKFAVTTATLYFPRAAGTPRVCLSCLVQEGHRLRHRVLGERKMHLVRQIAGLPRRSAQRSALFNEMHDELSTAWTQTRAGEWERHVRQAEARALEEKILFDRELFYAIQPRERLEELIASYRVLA